MSLPVHFMHIFLLSLFQFSFLSLWPLQLHLDPSTPIITLQQRNVRPMRPWWDTKLTKQSRRTRGVGCCGRWEGGSRWRGHMCTYGWFMLMYGRNQYNIVEIILQLKNIQKTFSLPTCLLFPLFLPLSFLLPLSFALSLPLRHCCLPRKLCGPPEVKAVTPPWLPSGAPPLPSRSQSPAGQCTVESLLRPASVVTCFLTGRDDSSLETFAESFAPEDLISLDPQDVLFLERWVETRGMWVSGRGQWEGKGWVLELVAWNPGIPELSSKTCGLYLTLSDPVPPSHVQYFVMQPFIPKWNSWVIKPD